MLCVSKMVKIWVGGIGASKKEKISERRRTVGDMCSVLSKIEVAFRIDGRIPESRTLRLEKYYI